MRLRTRLILIFFVTILSLGLIARYGLKLGLDLRGGTRLVLQVVTDDAVRAETDRAIETVNRLGLGRFSRLQTNELGLSVASTAQAGTVEGAIAEQLPNWAAESAFSNGQAEIRVKMGSAYEQSLRRDAVAQTIRVIRNRLDALGVAEVVVQPQGGVDDYQVLVQLPGIDDQKRVEGIVKSTAVLEIKLVDDRDIPQDVAVISGIDLKDAFRSHDGAGRPAVGFSLRPDAAQRFGRVTESNIGRRLAILLDGRVQSIATIENRITDSGIIQGGSTGFSAKEVDDLVLILKSGALPASIQYLQQQVVGPTLGSDSVRHGITAGAVALTAVSVFMLSYYRWSGLNAIVAMLLNVVVLLALMAYFGAALTLPGMAGIILTIGVGIDSNVLIFERIREELRTGAPAVSALKIGFQRVFTTLLDTHLAALISAAFLFLFGTGPVKGFAVTLVLGLVSNLFTSVFVSRTIFDWAMRKERGATRLSI